MAFTYFIHKILEVLCCFWPRKNAFPVCVGSSSTEKNVFLVEAASSELPKLIVLNSIPLGSLPISRSWQFLNEIESRFPLISDNTPPLSSLWIKLLSLRIAGCFTQPKEKVFKLSQESLLRGNFVRCESNLWERENSFIDFLAEVMGVLQDCQDSDRLPTQDGGLLRSRWIFIHFVAPFGRQCWSSKPLRIRVIVSHSSHQHNQQISRPTIYSCFGTLFRETSWSTKVAVFLEIHSNVAYFPWNFKRKIQICRFQSFPRFPEQFPRLQVDTILSRVCRSPRRLSQ